MTKERVIAAMSGGVDSAVAAGLLLEAGYDVVGVTMKMYAPSRARARQELLRHRRFRRRAAQRSGAGDSALRARLRGDVPAQRHRALRRRLRCRPNAQPLRLVQQLRQARNAARVRRSAGARFVATGHYARIDHRDRRPASLPQRVAKDQAYALAQLAPAQLERLLLPLGELDKAETRAHARRLGLPVHDKPESQDICFVEGGDYRDVVQRLRPRSTAAGDVVATTGEQVGTHAGIARLHVGQRAGLPPRSDGPRYVTRIDANTNTLVVGREDELLSRDAARRRAQPDSAGAVCGRRNARAGDDPLPRRPARARSAFRRRRHAHACASTSRNARSHPASSSRCFDLDGRRSARRRNDHSRHCASDALSGR